VPQLCTEGLNVVMQPPEVSNTLYDGIDGQDSQHAQYHRPRVKAGHQQRHCGGNYGHISGDVLKSQEFSYRPSQLHLMTLLCSDVSHGHPWFGIHRRQPHHRPCQPTQHRQHSPQRIQAPLWGPRSPFPPPTSQRRWASARTS